MAKLKKVEEKRCVRVPFLCTPILYDKMYKRAIDTGASINDIINKLCEKHFNKEGK